MTRARVDLSGVRTQLVDAGFEWTARTHQRLDGEGTCGVGGIGEEPCPVNSEASLGEHAFRPVEQAQPLLRLELDRFEAFGFEHAGGGNSLAIDQEEALADERESKVGEWGKVARRTDRTPIGNGREQVTAKELDEALDDGRTDAGMALRERSSPEQQHRSNRRTLEEISDAGCVAADKVVLQFGGLLDRDASVRERTEAGRDPVRHLVVGDDRLDQGPGGCHPRGEIRPDLDVGLLGRATAATSAMVSGDPSTMTTISQLLSSRSRPARPAYREARRQASTHPFRGLAAPHTGW